MASQAQTLTIEYCSQDCIAAKVEEIISIPFSSTPLTQAKVIRGKLLTTGSDVKNVYQIDLRIPETWRYKAGDVIGIMPKNRSSDVEKVAKILKIEDNMKRKCILSPVSKNSKKKYPNYVGKVTTLETILTYCVDLKSVPKKLLIRTLADHTVNGEQKSELLFLCSQGCKEYTEYISTGKGNIVQLLECYSAIDIPIHKLIQHLPPLTPRCYSIASSQADNMDEITLVFSLEQNALGKGLCSGMLEQILNEENQFANVYLRSKNFLNFPQDLLTNVIMIALGTGIAPFLGFLKERDKLKPEPCGDLILFYGCRYKDRDFLFKKELHDMRDSGVLKRLFVCYSRDDITSHVKHVQDSIKLNAEVFLQYMFQEKCVICYCGSLLGSKSVLNAVSEILTLHRGYSETEASEVINNFQSAGKYIQEIWN